VSVWTTRVIECPRCSASNELQLADSVHVSRVPEVRSAVLDRTFHRATCRECAAPLEVERQVLYIDVERGHWILVVPALQAERWPELEVEFRNGLERALDHGSPLIAPVADDVRRRLVFGYEQLREKLVIWGAGLDDAVVECVKLRAIAADPGLAAPGTELVVDAVTPGDELVILCPRDADVRLLVVPGGLVRATDNQRSALRTRYPELFHGHFVNIARLLGPHYRRPEPTR
jgi:hypothetical protein